GEERPRAARHVRRAGHPDARGRGPDARRGAARRRRRGDRREPPLQPPQLGARGARPGARGAAPAGRAGLPVLRALPDAALRPALGPDSAGAAIGVSWVEGGLETPSVTDLNLVLGRVNPDYFLGGEVKLDTERARAAIEEQIAKPLGLGVEEAAAGVIELFDE